MWMRAISVGCGLVLSLGWLALGASAEVRPDQAGTGAFFVRNAGGGAWLPAPTLETDVTLDVTGTIVRARLVQRFRNPTDHWLEGVYVFPLPEKAAVDHLDVKVGQRVIEGRIEEREEAKRTYERAKQEGRKTALVEQERPNVFTTSLANVGPGEEVEVAIEYQEALRFDAEGFRLRFPLVVGPRYIPGTPGAIPASHGGTGWGVATDAVPDAGRITPLVLHPKDGPINPVRLRVDLDAGLPLERLVSPSHVVAVEELGTGRRRVVMGDYADRDFVLEWKLEAGASPRAAVFSEPAPGGAHVLLMLVPPEADETSSRLDREVVFVVDVSGSMSGPSIEQARAALLLALGRLAPGDRFNVVRFSHETHALFETAVPAHPDALETARKFVETLRADGGTEMLPALELALGTDTGATPLRQVVFVTDGSVGNEQQLFAAIDRGLGRSRLFTVGIGSAPNGHFMSRAAKLGRGTHTYIVNPAEVDEKMNALFRKLERPVLADVEVLWDEAVEMWPTRVPDLYAGEPIVVTAKVERFAGEVVVRGRRAGELFEVTLPLEPGEGKRGVGVLWARRKIASLMEGVAIGADPKTVRDAVVAVALEHHLVSKYTSLVAVDVTPTRPASEGLLQSAVPTNLPAGWNAASVGGVLPATATPAPLLRWVGLWLIAAGLFGLALRRRVA
jgi:Ca-activated chloride channel family protein